MEAVNEPQDRTKVNVSAGCLVWVSFSSNLTPNIRSWPGSGRGGSGVVEIGRIVDAVFVQDQRAGKGAEFDQPMPVGCCSVPVAGLP